MNNSGELTPKLKVGVFDSGIGGLSVVNAIKSALPEYEVLFRQDEANFPYGTREPGRIMRLVEPILQDMVKEGCGVIVIACNTVTTTSIHLLRHLVPVPLIGIPPMLEDAVKLTKTGKIAVCATPTVYGSSEYYSLKQRHAASTTVFEIECRDWPYMDGHEIVDDAKIGARIEEVIEYGADVIVLAATHYHWIEEKIKYVAALHGVTVLQPEEATVTWLRAVLGEPNSLVSY